MNVYQTWFAVKCPNSDQRNTYRLRIESEEMIMAEKINEVLATLEPSYHEEIADQLLTMLGGVQTITATHHGIEIETRRGTL